MIAGKAIEKRHNGQDLLLIYERFFGDEAHVDSTGARSETPET
jgi:hypothetical protein